MESEAGGNVISLSQMFFSFHFLFYINSFLLLRQVCDVDSREHLALVIDGLGLELNLLLDDIDRAVPHLWKLSIQQKPGRDVQPLWSYSQALWRHGHCQLLQ